jgi:thiamine biosynthesis lipoprotein
LLNTGFAQHKTVTAQSDITQMLKEIAVLSAQSQGLFNPAIGRLINLWGFQRDAFTAIDIVPEQIKALVEENPNMSDIEMSGYDVTSKNTTVQLELGGYAKGYALDLAIGYLKAQHVEHALINIGGNIMALGENDGRPWRVGVQHPRKPEALATIALQSGWAIGTSGDYQRYFELDGKRYCHLINPNTGYPVQHTQAVTVLIPPQKPGQIQAGVLSDVASKPIFIADFSSKVAMAKQFNIAHYLVVADDGTIYASPKMLAQLAWTQEDVAFKTLQ